MRHDASTLNLLFAIMLFLSAGCHRQPALSPYKWPAVGGEFDSITVKLELMYHDYAPFDSLEHYHSLMDSLARHCNDDYSDVKKARALYWRARFASRLELTDSAILLLQRSMLLNDSDKYYYDRLRMISLLCIVDDQIDEGTKYRHLEEAITYRRKIGDEAYEAYASILMGNLLANVGEYDKSLAFFDRSDSLNFRLGFHKLPVKNTINRARVLHERGDRNVADSLLKSVIGHPALANDIYTQNVIPRNLFSSTREKKYLLQAHDEIKDRPNFRHLRALYRALLSEVNFNEKNYDSTVYYAREAMADMEYVKDYGHRAIIWFNRGLAWSLENNADSALACRIRYEIYLDSATSLRRANEVMRLNALHDQNVRESEYASALYRRNMIIVMLVVAIIIASLVSMFIISRRHMRQKMKVMERELDLEITRRKMAATALTIEEKDRMLGHLRDSLSEMREQGVIRESNARSLESSIKAHLLEHEHDDTFQEMFDTVNPHFTARLRQMAPDLADSYLRLACYILMDFDNKRIASLMMIKPESVRQARWRLSQRLHLPKDTTLEDFLRTLNTRR